MCDYSSHFKEIQAPISPFRGSDDLHYGDSHSYPQGKVHIPQGSLGMPSVCSILGLSLPAPGHQFLCLWPTPPPGSLPRWHSSLPQAPGVVLSQVPTPLGPRSLGLILPSPSQSVLSLASAGAWAPAMKACQSAWMLFMCDNTMVGVCVCGLPLVPTPGASQGWDSAGGAGLITTVPQSVSAEWPRHWACPVGLIQPLLTPLLIDTAGPPPRLRDLEVRPVPRPVLQQGIL